MKARPDEMLTISARLRVLRCGRLLHHPHRPAQVDLDLARHVVQVAILIEIQISHDTGVIDEGIECRKLRKYAVV